MHACCQSFAVASGRRMTSAALSGSKWIIAITFVVTLSHGFAGQETTYNSQPQPVADADAPIVRTSRGLITLEGPSGMFLNPTSATLPQGAFDLGYCFVLTDGETDLLEHHMFLSYGVRDWLELGVVADAFQFTRSGQELPQGVYGAAGPMVRIRLLRDRRWWPELSLGAYSKWGTDNFASNNTYLALSKTLPISNTGVFKTITFQTGFRESWLDEPSTNTNRFYGGLELQLPHDFFLIGEVTQFARAADKHTPWSVGIQWRGRRFGVLAAVVQGGDDNRPGIYLGVGGGLGPEPVRIPTRPLPPH